MKNALSPLFLLHIGAGSLALVSGTAAAIFRKGSRRHRSSGNVFVVSMLALAISGAYIGFVKHQTLNGMMGVLTTYLVATAWWTARNRTGKAGAADLVALLVPLGVGACLVYYGFEAAKRPPGSQNGYPAAAYFIFGSLALLLAAGDVRMLVRGGVFGARRIARHLVRMGLAMFVAAGSFFLGQQQVFPEALRRPLLLSAPVFLIVFLMVFWWVRVRFSRRAMEAFARP